MAGTTNHSSLAPSPSPSPSPSLSLPNSVRAFDSTPSWHFPGPSSVFHKREKVAPKHLRAESYTIPVAPVLSTERRAHTRAQSSAIFARSPSSLPTTPATSEKTRSPLSRFASYKSATMAGAQPQTPAKNVASSRPGSKLQDSPFSDYFTDDGRSQSEWGYSAPSPEVQRVLLRLNRLQSLLMRGGDPETERETLQIVEKRLDSMEMDLGSLHSQTRTPPELEDSGLFLEDEEQGEDYEEEQDRDQQGTPSEPITQYECGDDIFDEQPTDEQRQAEYDYLLLQAQEILSNVSKAQENLKQRHAELRELNEAHSSDMEEREREIEDLKSENEGLKFDLNHDHSELLFLKLNLKSLETEVDALDNEPPGNPVQSPRKTLQQDMDRWRLDWADVDARMKRRRSPWGLSAPGSRRDSPADGAANRSAGDDAWQIETVKKAEGQVERIIVRRTTGSGRLNGLDGGDDVEGKPSANGEADASSRDASSTPSTAYADQTTQTESVPLSLLTDDEDVNDKPAPEDDCAITTSSEAGDSDHDEPQYPATPTSSVKSAWQDLWHGLSNLAGMGEERFD